MSPAFFKSRNKLITLRMIAASVLVMLVAAQLEDRAIALAQPPPAAATEYDLKLARIYATAKFITWPDDASDLVTPFVIGVVDPDPFNGGLQQLAKRKLRKRPIQVVHITSDKDYTVCHLLFIPSEAKSALVNDIIQRTGDQPVLIWRDQADPKNSTGVACTFIRQESELLIEADPAELKRRNLAPDGQLMNLKLVRMAKPSK